MEPVTVEIFDKAKDYGFSGFVLIAVLWMLRDQIAGALRPGDRTTPNEVVRELTLLRQSVEKNTEATLAQTGQFTVNNQLFASIAAEVGDIKNDMSRMLVEMARGMR